MDKHQELTKIAVGYLMSGVFIGAICGITATLCGIWFALKFPFILE